ncbi:hypothetical protein [Micromonospora sp. WMMD708]|uniref:hypothetical protein n=1 Tax=Micromonospora sp. WMMD708 TaxID=3403464 RepID=UPI003BF57545
MTTELSYIERRMITLAEVLLTRTREAKVEWSTTDRGNRFSHSGRSSSVWIEGKFDSDGDWNGTLTLLNSEGEVVELLQCGFEPRGDDTYNPSPWNKTLEELHDLARRRALNVDKVIDETLRELGID